MTGKRRQFLKKVFGRITYILVHIKQEDVRVFFYCLLGASCLWVFHSLSKTHTETISYPIEFSYNEEQYMEIKPLPKSIELHIKASGWQIIWKIFRVGIKPIRYEIEVPFFKTKPFLLSSQIRKEITNAVRNASILHINTDTIPIELDLRDNKILSVAVDSLNIPLLSDYRLTSPIRISPKRIALTGPEKMLATFTSDFKLDLKEKKIGSSFDKSIKVELPSYMQNLVKMDEQYIQVSFEVARFSTAKSKVKIEKVNFPENSKFQLPDKRGEVEIKYTFPTTESANIKLSDFVIVADYDTFQPLDSTITLQLKNKPTLLQKKDIKFSEHIKLKYER